MLGIIIVVVVGLVAGLLLSIASIVFAVEVNPIEEALVEVLPGANCGACGYSGCGGYAAAMALGEAEPGACSPGGPDVAEECGEILGKSTAGMEKKVAVVQCAGNCENVAKKTEYVGIESCAAAAQMWKGDSACAYGCLGHGDCVGACQYDAIHVIDGLATVDKDKCVACGLCAKACPKNVIMIQPAKFRQHVRCVNTDKGGETRKICKTGCIGCMKCQKECPFDAIHVVNFNAVIDYDKCKNCGKCKKVCPVGAIQ